ncbi:MAG: glutaredoxin family protein [Candidatus Andersenbacteria bacterium]|nr:glutaredoxin family protein [Candidatus Andersenbacteria bacterium]MBI3250383.1 glutaredoxin family protein [Candidatus Andersenbacteria bacterium]
MAQVTVYTTQTCGYCKATKQYLGEHNIPYTEIDVGVDRDKAREMIEKSGQMGVPVIIITKEEKEETIIGFDQARLAGALGIA